MKRIRLHTEKTEKDRDDCASFDNLFRLYYDKLLHIAKGYVTCQKDAEEIVQNTFLKLWENRSDIGSIRNINSYLYTLTRNGCLDLLKHREVRLGYSEKKKSIQQQFLKDEAASLLLENELQKKINESIELLPDKCKEVFVKSRIEGMKRKEIATLLNLSPRTVDNHIANALKHMRLHLKDFISLFL